MMMRQVFLVAVVLFVSSADIVSDNPDCIQETTTFSGGDLLNFRNAENITDCVDACIRKPTCMAFTYRTSDGKCWLKTLEYTSKTKNNFQSGVLSCFSGTGRGEESEYVNVALLDNVTATQTNTKWGYSAGRAIDGDWNTDSQMSTCSFSNSNKQNYLQIDLQKSYQIDHFVIYGRSDSNDGGAGTLYNARLLVGDQICDTLTGFEDSPKMGKVFNCGGDASKRVGRIVTIENWPTKVSVCELQIMVHEDMMDTDSAPTPSPTATTGQQIGDYYNVAYRRSVTASTEVWSKKKEMAVDGWALQNYDLGSCLVTDDGSREEYLSIDLGRVYQIDHVTVYGVSGWDEKYNLAGWRVSIDDNICGRLGTTETNVDSVSCAEEMMAGQYVRIYQRNTHMVFCEVQVMVKASDIDVVPDSSYYWPGEKGDEVTNVALSRDATATQSSNFSSTQYLAPLAIDGFTNGNVGHGSVTHTAKAGNSWWEVDLGKAYPIQYLKIYGRTDCCQDRIDGARVFVGKSQVATLATPEEASDVMGVDVGGVVARRVRVDLLNEYLSIAEVEVYVANEDVMSDEEPPTVQERWENVAWNKPATQSSTLSDFWAAQWAVDGYPDMTDTNWKSCSLTEDEPHNWWEVDLGQEYYIDHILISGRNKNQERMSYATILIDGRTVAGFGEVDETIYFTFPLGGLLGQKVKIALRDDHLTLCEVQVMVDHEYVPDSAYTEPIKSSERNFALGAETTASSVMFGGEASLATDGDANADFFQGSCTFAGPVQNDNWVMVDLGSTITVGSVTIYPRLDAFGYECLDGAVVRVDEHVCGTVVWDDAKLYYTFTCAGDVGVVGSQVSISKPGWLSVCEIVVHQA